MARVTSLIAGVGIIGTLVACGNSQGYSSARYYGSCLPRNYVRQTIVMPPVRLMGSFGGSSSGGARSGGSSFGGSSTKSGGSSFGGGASSSGGGSSTNGGSRAGGSGGSSFGGASSRSTGGIGSGRVAPGARYSDYGGYSYPSHVYGSNGWEYYFMTGGPSGPGYYHAC